MVERIRISRLFTLCAWDACADAAELAVIDQAKSSDHAAQQGTNHRRTSETQGTHEQLLE